MTVFSALGIPVRAHWTLLLLPFLLLLTGLGSVIGVVLISALLHETAHALAALAAGVHMRELILSPFGGALHIDGLWAYRPGQIAVVALAGPLMSLLVMMGAASLAWAGLVPESAAGVWVRINLLLAAFNLMPALPLDGGRVLAAALGLRMKSARALRVGVMMGYLLGAMMVALVIWQFASARRLNLTFVLCAVYLFISGPAENRAAGGAELLSLLSRADELRDEEIMPIAWIAAHRDARCTDVLRRLRTRRIHRIAVYDDALRLMGILEERALIAAASRSDPCAIGDFLASSARAGFKGDIAPENPPSSKREDPTPQPRGAAL
jgi:stage IV sporulation protein FB